MDQCAAPFAGMLVLVVSALATVIDFVPRRVRTTMFVAALFVAWLSAGGDVAQLFTCVGHAFAEVFVPAS